MKMRKKFYLLSLLLICSIGVNFIFRRHIAGGYAEALTYEQLYHLQGELNIKQISQTSGNLLQLDFSGKGIGAVNGFKVFCEDSLIIETHSPDLVFQPVRGTHGYRIFIQGLPQPVHLKINFTPVSEYLEHHHTSNAIFSVSGVSIPVTPQPWHSLSDWEWSQRTAAGSKATAAGYIRDSMLISALDGSETRILKIGQFILKYFKVRPGIPSDSMAKMDPLEQFEFAKKGHSQVWCGNLAEMFAFFGQQAGLPVRIVGCGRWHGPISSAHHVFNEVYIKEEQCWAYTDLTSGNLLVKHRNRLLNAIDVARILSYDLDDSGMVAFHFDNDTVQTMPYHLVNESEKYYFHAGSPFIFYFGNYQQRAFPVNSWNKALNVFDARPYYALYADDRALSNSTFYLRIVSNYLLLLSGILWLAFTVYYVLRYR